MAIATPFEILPAIDLRGGRVVRLRQGDFERETAYDDDPVDVAVGFALAGARWIHVVDLDGARTGAPAHGRVVAAIVAAAGGLTRIEVAGGLRDERTVAAALDAGAARVVVGTAALGDPAFARRLIEAHGPGRIAVALDVRDGNAVGHGWSARCRDPRRDDRDRPAGGRRRRDLRGDRHRPRRPARGAGPRAPRRMVALERGSIIASGGVSSVEDVRAVRAIGCTGAILGRALYEGRLDLVAALAIATSIDGV